MNPFEELTQKIGKCDLCIKRWPESDEIVCDIVEDTGIQRKIPKKPCVEFEVYTKWNPLYEKSEAKSEKKHIHTLFICETPPPEPPYYFYNPNISSKGLRMNVFRLLEINGENETARIEEFKSRGFFLIDTIKCRYIKNKKVKVEHIEMCAQTFLPQELDILKPKNLCILGETAFKGVKKLPEFRNLKKQYGMDLEWNLKGRKIRILTCYLPLGWNMRKDSLKKCIDNVFTKIRSMNGQ